VNLGKSARVSGQEVPKCVVGGAERASQCHLHRSGSDVLALICTED
jgi:hypothetical protein